MFSHDLGILFVAVAHIRFRAGIEQHCDNLDVTAAGRKHQGGIAKLIFIVDHVWLCLQEQCHHIRMSVIGGQHKCCIFAVTEMIGFGAGREEFPGYAGVTQGGSPGQQAVAIAIHQIWFQALLQEESDNGVTLVKGGQP